MKDGQRMEENENKTQCVILNKQQQNRIQENDKIEFNENLPTRTEADEKGSRGTDEEAIPTEMDITKKHRNAEKAMDQGEGYEEEGSGPQTPLKKGGGDKTDPN